MSVRLLFVAAVAVAVAAGVLAVAGPAGAETAPLKVLILGDSYSAGNGTGTN